MKATKERILLTALALFAQKGYEAVSVSDIAGELGITKSSLYKHFENKRAIFDSIISEMERLDAVQSESMAMPTSAAADIPDNYAGTELENTVIYAKAMLRYWTENPFASAFRRMLTLEQYCNAEQSRLYRQYIADGPVGYMTDVFTAMGIKDSAVKASEFYAPMFLAYTMYDTAQDRASVLAIADACIDNSAERIKNELSN